MRAMDAKPFAHELALLPELPLREKKVAERLKELPVEAAVELLHSLVRLAETGDDDARIALLVCVELDRYEKALGYDYLAGLYVTADGMGYEDVKRLLTTSEARKRARKPGRVENEHVERTLGERTELARVTRDRDLLDRLLFDRNPLVIRTLLANPRIVERDVVKIAAMRPTSPKILDEIVRSGRWSPRYGVKKALVLNPYSPVNTAISLLTFLNAPDLDDVAASVEVSDALRSAARDLLARRARGGSGEDGPPSGMSS